MDRPLWILALIPFHPGRKVTRSVADFGSVVVRAGAEFAELEHGERGWKTWDYP